MATVTSASAAVTEAAKIPPPKPPAINGKLRVMCRYGGSIVSFPQTKSLHYIGGDTRIVAVPAAAAMSFSALVNHLKVTLGVSYGFKIKYQLPDHGLDSLISVETDEDLQIMMEEHGRLYSGSSTSQSRIHLFLFPVNEGGPSQAGPAQSKAAAAEIDWSGIEEPDLIRCGLTQPILHHPKTETWFVDALRSSGIVRNEGSNGSGGSSGDGSGGLCGQESIMLETNSSFGSTSSTVSLTNLPPIMNSGEDNMANLQVKFAPTESVASENGVVAPTSHVQTGSSHELPVRPHFLENKVYSNLYGTETSLLNHPGMSQVNKPVSVPGYPPSPFLDPAQQQHIQVIYPGQPYVVQNPPGVQPAASYYAAYHPLPHQMNHVHYQPPQPYPVYYIPVEQHPQPYTSHTQSGLMGATVVSTNHPPANPSASSSAQQSESPVVRCNSPLIPELASPMYPTSQSSETAMQTSSEAHHIGREAAKYNNDVEEDAARAQIYKSQPPAPMLPSQYQTVMLTEAFGQLRTGNA